jgi:hypothetical protein
MLKPFSATAEKVLSLSGSSSEGEVPHIRVGARRIMFDPHALNPWLAKRDTSTHPRRVRLPAFLPEPVSAHAGSDADVNCARSALSSNLDLRVVGRRTACISLFNAALH